jgi:carbamoyltransferase
VLGWQRKQCSVDELAALLADGKPVVVLSGRAEIGPRALGHRSIMASPTSPAMKETLNEIKGRESYRPVAPMCLEEHAATIFDPGCPDPYMLFDHKVREEWVDKIPAVLHLDGTARLQTVTEESLPYKIVNAFYKLTGIPVLCNTSANMSGKGFFPDVASALRWAKIDHVWSEGFLYTSFNAEALQESTP